MITSYNSLFLTNIADNWLIFVNNMNHEQLKISTSAISFKVDKLLLN